jgi:hypothetical protein
VIIEDTTALKYQFYEMSFRKNWLSVSGFPTTNFSTALPLGILMSGGEPLKLITMARSIAQYLGTNTPANMDKRAFICAFGGVGSATFILLKEILQIQQLTFPMNYTQLPLMYPHVICLWEKVNQRGPFPVSYTMPQTHTSARLGIDFS